MKSGKLLTVAAVALLLAGCTPQIDQTAWKNCVSGVADLLGYNPDGDVEVGVDILVQAADGCQAEADKDIAKFNETFG